MSDAILIEGDPRLRARCAEIGDGAFDDDLRRLAAALSAARARHGFGRALAAPQIGIARRMIAVDLGAGPFALIDPEITWTSPEQRPVWDDCFSVPDRIARVLRHRSVSLRYRDEQRRVREWPELPFELAELVQHEIDHLDGVLMIDRAKDIQPIARHSELVAGGRSTHRLSLAAIAEGARSIDPVFLGSPLLDWDGIALKIETINPVRSFKGRGADRFIATCDADRLVCASAGNFGIAMAYVCRARRRALTVYAAETASAFKLDRIRALGATVIQRGADFDAAKTAARADTSARFVEDGADPAISEGAGSIGVELGRGFDAVVVPVGDGALIGGIARWLAAASPATRVIGVVSRGAQAMRDSWLCGEVVVHDRADTIADGIAVREPVAAALADLRGTVHDIVAVDDAALVDAMRRVHSQVGLVVEPSGVAGLAAILADRARFAGRVATILTGGNLSREQVIAWL